MSNAVKPRILKVTSVCSVCYKPVCATTKDKAVRHGFKRYKKRRVYKKGACVGLVPTFSQEDDKPCKGSGQEVVYKRV